MGVVQREDFPSMHTLTVAPLLLLDDIVANINISTNIKLYVNIHKYS